MYRDIPKSGRRLTTKIVLLFSICFAGCYQAVAQSDQLPFQQIDLSNLEAFQSTTDNWQIAGSVFMDTFRDHHVAPRKGQGVLVNTAEGNDPEDIYTSWEHGDMDLELDVMMAKGSNSGIYLQGRYEIQLFDSWGAENPTFADLGGIYQWWENGEGTGGVPPRVNAARAPGVWQHLEIKFRAPRFNDQGKKIAHAQLEEVILNGHVIHTDLKLMHPTGGAISEQEVAEGPLRFQGDHGPVAFRNIKVKQYDNDSLLLRDISYKYYERSDDQEDYDASTNIDPAFLVAEGRSDELGLQAVQRNSHFGIVYQASVDIQYPGDYLFELLGRGGQTLAVDDQEVIGSDSQRGTVNLSKGSHQLTITYFRGQGGNAPSLSLRAEGPGIELHDLHAPSATAADVRNPDPPKLVDPEERPMVMHGFMQGIDRVHPHSAAVGYPGDIHFAMDLNNGSVLKIWKGSFLNISTMWVGRGGGKLALNETAALPFSGAPSFAILEKRNTAWPDSLEPSLDYHFRSYRFEDDQQLLFNYEINGKNVEDRFQPQNEARMLKRSLSLNGDTKPGNLYFRITKGESISELPNGLYQVNDQSFLIQLPEEIKKRVRIRSAEDGQELVLPINNKNASFSYTYIW